MKDDAMHRAIKHFNRAHKPNKAWLDEIDSYRGFYRVCVEDDWGCYTSYTFESVREFKEWTDGVVFENEL